MMKNMNKLIENRDMMQENMAKVKKILEVNRSGSIKDEAVKNLMKKNRNKVMSTENLAEKAGNIAGKKNAKIILRDLAIENLRKKGCVISKDGAVTNDGYGNVIARKV